MFKKNRKSQNKTTHIQHWKQIKNFLKVSLTFLFGSMFCLLKVPANI